MATPSSPSLTLAILIDADNASPAIAKGLVDEVAKLGRATVRRIYGNWTTPDLAGWRAVLLEHSITPIQQFAYTKGKNATDSTMIIDAMDLLYAGNVDGFCIVSSDSDFTRLASRLRESGKLVYGFGEKKTPQPFVVACDRFIYTEVLGREKGQPGQRKTAAELEGDRDLVELVGGVVDDSSDETGWAHLGHVGNILQKQRTDFDSRNYGYAKLSDLVEQIEGFEVKRQEKGVLVRRRPSKP